MRIRYAAAEFSPDVGQLSIGNSRSRVQLQFQASQFTATGNIGKPIFNFRRGFAYHPCWISAELAWGWPSSFAMGLIAVFFLYDKLVMTLLKWRRIGFTRRFGLNLKGKIDLRSLTRDWVRNLSLATSKEFFWQRHKTATIYLAIFICRLNASLFPQI